MIVEEGKRRRFGRIFWSRMRLRERSSLLIKKKRDLRILLCKKLTQL